MGARARPQALVGEPPQGVGCRPFLRRLTRALGLTRWVSHPGVCREVGGLSGSELRRRGRAGRWWLAVLGLLAMCVFNTPLSTQPARPVVYLVPVAGMIDLGLAPFVQRVLAEAAGAAAVILEINTFGGRVDAAVLIRDALLQARVRTVAFVNKRAISAGALISLAAETIAVAKDGIQLHAICRVTVRTNIDRLVGGAGEETVIARVGEGMVSTIGSAATHKERCCAPWSAIRCTGAGSCSAWARGRLRLC